MSSATPDPAVDDASEPEERRSFLSELPGLLLAALVVAVLIKTFIIQPFYIPSGSMIPTLLIDDRVMVSKLNYRLGDPGHGDVVVFENPWAEERTESVPEKAVRAVLEALGIRTSQSDDLIKRVVGIGGDQLEIRSGRVYIDDAALDEPYLPQDTSMPDYGPITIPAGHVFVMGDNRAASSDSRVFGPIPESDIIGKAVMRIWPLDRLGSLSP
ncbi:MAG TPA: signal peptidase I [Acidimicrobiia bacterium]